MNKFEIEKFITPNVSFAPVYIWVWNDVCTREIIDNQLAEMQNLGIRAFYILPEPKEFRPNSMPTNLEPEYLSDEYAELCLYAFEQGKKLGMNCWIYDEGGWPSGSACGKVIKDRPEFAKQVLMAYERKFSAGETYHKINPNTVASFIDDSIMISDGHIFAEDSAVSEYVCEKENGSYPDLLNKNATEYFIEITHKKYKLSDNVTAVFTDEPKAPTNAFNAELVEKYESVYGESVLPHFPLIAGRVDVTEENVHVLHRWYDLCSQAFCDNFLLPCKKWSNDNGLKFTGHLDKDHHPLGFMNGGNNFNLMRALRCLDIPGIDVILRQLYPENPINKKDDMNGYNGFFPRYASSAAAQIGSKTAMCEIMGVAGAAVTYDIMRFTVGYLAVRGINIFNLFNVPLGRKGALLAQELPIYTESQPYYKHLNLFNRYMERLSYVSSLGKRICNTALYYPVSDFQGRLHANEVAVSFDSLGRELENKTVDFDIIDDDVIRSAEISDGFLRIGNAEYHQIFIPENAFIPLKTKEKLNEFTANGGVISHDVSHANPVIRVNNQGLRAIRRKAVNAEIFFLFRESGNSSVYQVDLPANGYLLTLENGSLQRINAGIRNIQLAVGETAVILLTDETLDSDDKKDYVKTEISEKLTLRKDVELICNENGFDNVHHCEEAVSVTLGDWSEFVGKGYSGSCVYETSFEVSDNKIGKAGEIDLGEVRFSASVYLNDRFLGTALMTPYKLKIPCGVLNKTNTLRVIVTNTCANWYLDSDYFDKWSISELSPYFEKELEYARDYASGGLIGPITLFTDK